MTAHALADVLPSAMPGRDRRRTQRRLAFPDRPVRARVRAMVRAVAGRRSARSVLAELAADPAYLALKAALGEPLSPSERALLEAHWSALEAGPGGGE